MMLFGIPAALMIKPSNYFCLCVIEIHNLQCCCYYNLTSVLKREIDAIFKPLIYALISDVIFHKILPMLAILPMQDMPSTVSISYPF